MNADQFDEITADYIALRDAKHAKQAAARKLREGTSDRPLPAMFAWALAAIFCWIAFGWAVVRIWA